MVIAYIRERKNVLLFAGVIMLITSIPYLIGYVTENESWYFTGFVFAVEDGNSYIAKMLSGTTGKWLFKTPYSAIEQNGVIAFLPYILLGKLAGGNAIHEQLVALFHAFRILGGILYVLAGYDFISIFVKTKKWRWWALVVYTLGGGGGWVLALSGNKNLLNSLPLDFISPESFGFLGLLGMPHLAAGRAFLLWGLANYLEGRSGYLSGLYFLILGILQPIYVGIAWVVISGHLFTTYLKKRLLRESRDGNYFLEAREDINNFIKILLVSGPFIIYTAIAFVSDPFLQSWNKQNLLPSPHFFHYLIAYGIYLPLAIIGMVKISRHITRNTMLLAGWMIIFPALINLPFSVQRRLAEGIWIVVTIGMVVFFENSDRVPKILYSVLCLAFPSTLFILAGSVLAVSLPQKPLYRPRYEVDMYKNLADLAEFDSVVLASYEIGNNLPAWVPVRVVLGHGPETAYGEKTKYDVNEFYEEDTKDLIRDQILDKYQVDFVIGDAFNIEQSGWDPGTYQKLDLLFANDEYAIYQTVLDN